jgi:hypothetical protein
MLAASVARADLPDPPATSAPGPGAPISDHRAEHLALMASPPVRTTTTFRFFGDEAVEDRIVRLAEIAEDRFTRLCSQLDACALVRRPIDVWIAEDAELFASVFPEPNPMSEWAAGVAFLDANRIVLRAHGTALFSLMETFDHELAHLIHHAFVRDGPPLPRWFAEGLAVWQAGESVVERLDAAVRAAATDDLIAFDDLSRRFPNDGEAVKVAYAQSSLFVKRLVRRHGPGPVVAILHDVRRGVPFDAAFINHLGAPPGDLFDALSEDLESASNPFVFLYDGNFLWGFTTVLFVAVAWWRLRDRKRQMARLAEAEASRIAAEDMALYEAIEARAGRSREIKSDPSLLN